MNNFLLGATIMAALTAFAVDTALPVSAGVKQPQVVQVSLGGEAGSPMTIKLDVPAVKAGLVEFDVSNDAIGTDHEVVLVKLDSKDQTIAASPKSHRVDEDKLKSLGEVGGLKPGDKGTLTVELTAGDYVLLCNHKQHYELGMYTPFTVTQ